METTAGLLETTAGLLETTAGLLELATGCLAGLVRSAVDAVRFVPKGHSTGGVTLYRGGGSGAASTSRSTRTAATDMFSMVCMCSAFSMVGIVPPTAAGCW